MIREIIIWPDSILTRTCEPVTQFTDDIRQLFCDMEATMLFAKGAGLAAPQVGFALRMIVLKVRSKVGSEGFERDTVVKLANPEIVEISTEKVSSEREGCLSLPGYFHVIPRAASVRVKAQDEQGNFFEIGGDGTLAIALQHEMDHLNGVVFVDYLSSLKKDLVRNRFQRAKKRGMRYRSEKLPAQDFTAK